MTNGPSTWRISVAQIAPKLGDVGFNFELHLRHIAAARETGSNLLVFPELSLTGYYLRDMVPDVGCPATAEEFQRLRDAAGPMAVAVGFVEQSRHHRFYNAALWLSPGQPARVHRKVYLPTYGLFDEQRYFARGDRFRAFDDPRFGRVGLLICEDLWHVSSVTILQAQDVDLLVCCANSPARGVDGPTVRTAETYERMCRCYAELLGCVVVLANRVGFEDGLCFWGGSLVAGPDGGLLGQAPILDDCLLTVDFDPAELRRRRVLSPLSRDEQLLLTVEELLDVKRRRADDPA